MEIHGLTSQQIELCDILWECNTEEQVNHFIASIPTEGWKREARNMQAMLMAAMWDEEVKSPDDCGLAYAMLDKIKNTKKK